MSTVQLRPGRKVQSVEWPDGGYIECEIGMTMVVSEECGQMGMVPWVTVTYPEGATVLINPLQVAMIEFED